MTPIQAKDDSADSRGKRRDRAGPDRHGQNDCLRDPRNRTVKPRSKRTQALILCARPENSPSRSRRGETGLQIQKGYHRAARLWRSAHRAPICGCSRGRPHRDRHRRKDHRSHQPGDLKLDSVKVVVLDEADEMLNMGFMDDVGMISKKPGPTANPPLFGDYASPILSSRAGS